jgi:hypothetical protein
VDRRLAPQSTRRLKLAFFCAFAASSASLALGAPLLRSWWLPREVPVHVVGGGQVLLEVEVGGDGQVLSMTTLRATPPFTDLMRESVIHWGFDATSWEPSGGATARVLVAGVFRPPVLGSGPTLGVPPRDVDAPSTEIPYPVEIVVPPYPPAAVGDGLVLLVVAVGTEGQVSEAYVLEAQGPFAQVALSAARAWRFRPAEQDGQAVPAVAYLVFGFRSPIV